MFQLKKELAAGKFKIQVAISMNFLVDKMAHQGLAEWKECQHMIAKIMTWLWLQIFWY